MGFEGTQSSLNNAVGANNAIASGGLSGPIGGYSGTLMNDIKANAPGSVGAPGGGPSALDQMNPYLQNYFNAAAKPLTQTYQNVTAPNIVGNAAQTGTVGGSGATNAMNNANAQLAEGLGTLSAGIYEPAFAQAQQLSAEEQMQNQALATQSAQQAQGLTAQEMMQGRGIGGNLFGQGINATLGAIQAAPELAAGAYIPSQQMMGAGATAQQQLQQILDSGYANMFGQSQYPEQQLGVLAQGLSTVGGLGGGSQVQIAPNQGGFK